MRVAFYAPLKPPDHPVPSGDRLMARSLVSLLQRLGHEVELASRFRSYDRDGDQARQQRLASLGARLARRLARRLSARPPELWLTYHVYHKSPDHLGPAIARSLRIPYLIVEASVARRRAAGPWSTGYAASLDVLAAADMVLAMTSVDLDGLRHLLPAATLRLLPPFLDTAPFSAARAARGQHRAALARAHGLDRSAPWLLAVAMMRADAKRQSYRLLAEALHHLTARSWQILLVGDGEAADEIRVWFAPFGDRVRFLGALDRTALPPLYAACDLHVWPAVAEAYGMALLEAQAAGLPVLAGREGGVADIVVDGQTGKLAPARDPAAFAETLDGLLDRPELLARLGAQAASHAQERHGLAAAAQHLSAAITQAQANVDRGTAEVRACASA